MCIRDRCSTAFICGSFNGERSITKGPPDYESPNHPCNINGPLIFSNIKTHGVFWHNSHNLEPTQSDYERLLLEICDEFPRFKLIYKKESPLHIVIDKILFALTLGMMKTYLTHYQTTIGNRVYVTDDWDTRSVVTRMITLRHERVHLRQFKKYTFLGMSILYLAFPLPFGVAYFRAFFELEAYRESIVATYEYCGMEAVTNPSYKAHILSQFTGASYGWMWPYPKFLNKWYEEVINNL